jgi:hypothetical protein
MQPPNLAPLRHTSTQAHNGEATYMSQSLVHVILAGISAGMFIWLVASGLTLVLVSFVAELAHGNTCSGLMSATRSSCNGRHLAGTIAR